MPSAPESDETDDNSKWYFEWLRQLGGSSMPALLYAIGVACEGFGFSKPKHALFGKERRAGAFVQKFNEIFPSPQPQARRRVFAARKQTSAIGRKFCAGHRSAMRGSQPLKRRPRSLDGWKAKIWHFNRGSRAKRLK
jgi:hypothetical protein